MWENAWQETSRMFFFIVIPVSKPWIFGALTLVSLEVLADFGAASMFSVNTFTTAIYSLWTGFFSLAAAQQLSSILLIFILIFFGFAEFLKSKRRHEIQDLQRPFVRIKVFGFTKFLVIAFACSLTLLTSVIPVSMLIYWLVSGWSEHSYLDGSIILNSLIIAISAGIIATLLALILNLTKLNITNTLLLKITRPLLILGYALPGSVLAVSIVLFFSYFPAITQGWLWGSLLVLLSGLAIRYTAVFTINVEKALRRIPLHLRDISRTLGVSTFKMLKSVHIPLIVPSIVYTFLIVTIEALKEMPLTLMTRPVGWDTLAVKIFQYTSEGQWHSASFPALLLLLLGAVPIYFFSVLTNENEAATPD